MAFGSSFLAACKGKDAAAAGRSPTAAVAAGRSGSPTGRSTSTRRPADFEEATGIHAEYTEDINDNNEFFAKISEPLKRNQSIDREIIVLTDWMAGRLIRLGYAAPLDDSKFPNKANLEDNLRDVSFDPGRRYSVPWLSGMAGIGYNPKKTGRELTSVNDLFDPKFKGQVTMLTEMRDTVGLIMLGDWEGSRQGHQGGCPGGRGQDQAVPGERAHPGIHGKRLCRGPGRGKHRGGRSRGRGISRASPPTIPISGGSRPKKAPCSTPTTC